jgi:hypothetical protein
MVAGLKLELLSPNLVLLIDEILDNQNICKYLYYDDKNPLGQSTIADTSGLLLTKIFPYPFSSVITEECTQLRLYYPDGEFDSIGKIEQSLVLFDIICHKNLWLINDGTNSLIRPYEIMKELINLFDQSLSTVGKLKFKRFNHLFVNDKFDCIRLMAEMMTIGG